MSDRGKTAFQNLKVKKIMDLIAERGGKIFIFCNDGYTMLFSTNNISELPVGIFEIDFRTNKIEEKILNSSVKKYQWRDIKILSELLAKMRFCQS